MIYAFDTAGPEDRDRLPSCTRCRPDAMSVAEFIAILERIRARDLHPRPGPPLPRRGARGARRCRRRPAGRARASRRDHRRGDRRVRSSSAAIPRRASVRAALASHCSPSASRIEDAPRDCSLMASAPANDGPASRRNRSLGERRVPQARRPRAAAEARLAVVLGVVVLAAVLAHDEHLAHPPAIGRLDGQPSARRRSTSSPGLGTPPMR